MSEGGTRPGPQRTRARFRGWIEYEPGYDRARASSGLTSPSTGTHAPAPTVGPSGLALRSLTRAPLPVVVFSSLANLSVTGFSDGCRIVIAEEGLGGYLIERPMPAVDSAWAGVRLDARLVSGDDTSGQLISANSVRTPFVGPVIPGELRYHGVVLHLWNRGARPSAEDATLARAAVAHAVALVHEQRLVAWNEGWRDGDEVDSVGSAGAASPVAMSARRKYRLPSLARLHLVRGSNPADPDGTPAPQR